MRLSDAGHPYLTGLSIAGGLYYCGTEGVFIGPMILCCMLVGVNLYRLLLAQSTGSLQQSFGLLHCHHSTYEFNSAVPLIRSPVVQRRNS
ncbi:unnamed protein product [Hymenolepis diminuta]|uniref:Aa_trans domain-containing protein n=1 Tax=Hymenolepis diminuta TaxID=6216 RepID=A0A0R3SS45_HYMDI|nr:unnamed protein product [Hymenolepis diminuta]